MRADHEAACVIPVQPVLKLSPAQSRSKWPYLTRLLASVVVDVSYVLLFGEEEEEIVKSMRTWLVT